MRTHTYAHTYAYIHREAGLLDELQNLRTYSHGHVPSSQNPVTHEDMSARALPPLLSPSPANVQTVAPGQTSPVSLYGDFGANEKVGADHENDQKPHTQHTDARAALDVGSIVSLCPTCEILKAECQRIRSECDHIMREKGDLLSELEICRQKVDISRESGNWGEVEDEADQRNWRQEVEKLREQSTELRSKYENEQTVRENLAEECQKMRAYQHEAGALRSMVSGLQGEVDALRQQLDKARSKASEGPLAFLGLK